MLLELGAPRALRPLRPRGAAQRRLHAELRLRQPERPLLGVLRRRPVRRRRRAGRGAARTSAPRSRSSSPTPPSGVTRQVPFEVAVPARTATAAAPSPGRPRSQCSACGGQRPAAAGLAQRLRRVHPHPDVPALQRLGRVIESPCKECRGGGRVLEERSLDVEVPAGHPRRPAHPDLRRGPRRPARRRGGRRLRPRPRAARRALRPRGQRHLLRGRPDDDGGRARNAHHRADARRRRRARVRAGHAARRGARARAARHAGPAGLRPRRPSDPRQRRRPASVDRRPAQAARGVRAPRPTSRRTRPTTASSSG